MFDSTGDGVFDEDVRRLVRYKYKQIAVYRVKYGLTQQESKNLEEFVRGSVGKSYSVTDTLIVGAIKWFRSKRVDTVKEYCSRFVAQAFKSIGKELVHNCNYCSPRALSRSKSLYRVRNCYRLRNALDEIVLSVKNHTLENRCHLGSWLDEVKKISLAHEEHVATENDAYEFVARHREYDIPVSRIIEKSGFLDDYKVFFARYPFKLSPSGLYSRVGGDGYLQFLHNEIIDIQQGFRFVDNLKVCERNYMSSRLEVMRLLRDLYYKLVYIIYSRVMVLEYVTKAQGITEFENSDLKNVIRVKESIKAVLRGISVDETIFSQEELAYLSGANGVAQISIIPTQEDV